MDAAPHPAPLEGLPLLLIAADGSGVGVRVTLGWPRPDADGSGAWSCLLDLAGLGEHPQQIYGADGLQALALALRLAEVELTMAARRRRGRWVDPETREPVDLAAYFGQSVKAAAG